MSDQEGRPRQYVLSFLSCHPRFVHLHFTNEHRLHALEDDEDTSDMVVNASIFMMLTRMFDDEIEASIRQNSTGNIILSLPFGNRATFEKLMSWILYSKEPSDFVELQYCVEFARYYGIRVPFHEDNSIIHQKINEIEDVPFLDEQEDIPPPPDDDMQETLVGDEAKVEGFPDAVVNFYCDRKLLVIDEKIYKKRWRNKRKTGWYYYCLSPKCPGSVLVTDGGIRIVKDHDVENCHTTKAMAVDLYLWQEIDAKIRNLVSLNPFLSSFDILTSFLRENEGSADTLLTAPLAAVLQYISCLREQKDVELREMLTALSEIKDGSVIYQQVIPQRVLVYSSPNVKEFSDVKWILIDGTFKRCPKQFYQCVTFLSRERRTGIFFPLCHCLLPNKCYDTYNLMFSVVSEHFPMPNLEFVTVDFERALINAVKSWISGKSRPVHILGCKFHFSKCLTKHFRQGKKRSRKSKQPFQKGKKDSRKSEKKRELTNIEKAFISQFYSLPFLRRVEIEKILRALSTVEHPHHTFIRYFEKTWMGDDIFPLWNLSHRDGTGLGSMYTNNGIESFHKTMSRQLSPHPKIESFLRWAEAFAEESIQMIGIQGPREWERDLDHTIRRVDVIGKWMNLLLNYPTKPLYRPFSFGFYCPHCGGLNQLAGVRRNHLLCQNESCAHYRSSIQAGVVLDQVKTSLRNSLDFAIRQMIPRRQICSALENLTIWMQTLDSDNLPDNENDYIQRVCDFCNEERHEIENRVPVFFPAASFVG